MNFLKINWLEFLEKNFSYILGIILFIALLFNGFIYYKFIWQALRIKPAVSFKEVKFDEALYDKFQQNLKQREDVLRRISSQFHGDIFNP